MGARRLIFALVLLLALLLGYGAGPSRAGLTPQAARLAVSAYTASQHQDTQEYVQITHLDTDNLIGDVRISGNGKKVAYVVKSGVGSEQGDLYVADIASGASQLVAQNVHLADISYDGSKVLYWEEISYGNYRLYVSGVDITPCVSDPRIGYDVCLTPERGVMGITGDGKFVFYATPAPWECTPVKKHYGWDWNCAIRDERPRIWRLPADGGEPELWVGPILEENIVHGWPVRADYRGDRIAFVVHYYPAPDYYLRSDVYVGLGGNVQTLLATDTSWCSPCAFSADGQWLAVDCENLGSARDIDVFRSDGSRRMSVEIEGTVLYNDSLDIGEDGWRILTDNHSDNGLWLVNRDGTDPYRIPAHTSGDWGHASFSDDGQAVAFVSSDDLLNNGNSVQQLFVLKGLPAPDLSVDDIPLDLGAITFDGSRFVLPVDVTVRNVGDVGVSDVAVRLSDNGGWSETRTIASLSAGTSTVLHLDWDITAFLMAGGGHATVRLTVAADPDDVITELGNLNNTVTASLDVDARPRITAVQPTFTLDKSYFLDNESVSNPVQVYVDWNGDLSGNGDPPYGDVYFDLNGTQAREDGQQWGAQHIYDMGADFQAAFSCANNTLRVWATYPVDGTEFRSLETVIQPTVFPWPGWVEWAIQNIPGSDASFEVEPEAPLVKYSYSFKYPEPPFEATWTPPEWIPYLGGEKLGIQETQAQVQAEAKSDGSGAAEVSGETGLDLAAFSAEGRVWGKGETKFVCGESFDLQSAELGFEIKVPIEKVAGLTDVIPALEEAEDWPVVGRIIRWVNNIATVKATSTPGIKITTHFQEQDDELKFAQGVGTGSIDTRAELDTEPCDDLTAGVYGGGTPYVTIQVPKNPGYLKEVGIDLYYGASFKAWEFEAEYERKVNCHYPDGCSEVSDTGLISAAVLPQPGWHLIPRDYAGLGYARFVAAPRLGTTAVLQATATTTETLLTNIYPRPEPSLALRADGHRLLTYVHDDTSKPQGRGTEIYSLYWNGSSWSGPTRLTDDAQPDFAPAVAYDGSGTGVAVWERSALPAGITPTLDITFARSLEIAAATWNGSAWSGVVTLTSNSLLDTAPRLAATGDGGAMALWRTTDGEDILGTLTHPLTFTYAIWNGSAWSAPAAALTGLHDVLDVAFAAYSSTQAALVYAVDADGVLTTTADSDLYYTTFNGTAWSGPTRLTNDVITDTTPALAYDSAGRLHLLWLRGGDLVWLKGSWDVNDAQTVRAGSTEGGFLGFTLSRAPNGDLAVVWQGMGDEGAELTYSIYDATADSWGADNRLTAGADVEADHAPAFGSDGTLYVAYRHVETEFVTRTFTVSPTHTFTVTHIPQPGQSDLMFLVHTVGRDLTFEGLTITPTNPAPGQVVTLTAVLRNAGDLAVVNPQVAFYDGTSQIGSTQTLLTLAAGYTATVSTTWTIPSPAAAHPLKAVADPAGLVAETDETNNEIALQTTLPDLAVDLLHTDYDPATITVTVRIANGGVLTATAPFTVVFRAADPLTGTLLGTALVTGDLAAGAAVTVTLALTDPLSLAGLGAQLWAVADSDDVVTEADEGNNTDYAFLPALPDLALTAADIQGSGPVTVTVHNGGVLTATAPLLAVRDGSLTGTLVYSGVLGDIGPGASRTVTLTMEAGQVELWAQADPEDRIAESSEGNNLAVRVMEIPHRVYLPLVLRNK